MNTIQEADICPCCNRPYDIQDTPPKPKKALDDGFEAFWSRYPKKTAKPYCKEIWKRKRLSIELVLPALKMAIASRDWQKDGGQFIPNPSTWLNQGRWEDEGIDYQALSQRPIASSSTTTKINPDHAEEWRKENYELSAKLPFEMWPLHIRKQYLATLKP